MKTIEKQVLAAYDETDSRHIGDSDLDDEQPIAIIVRTTLGEVRRIRRLSYTMVRAEAMEAQRKQAEIDYDKSL